MIFLKYLSNATPFPVLKILSGNITIFPFYHAVGENTPVFIRQLHVIKNLKQFKEDINFFGKHYRFISIEEIRQTIENGNILPRNGIYLTFDDGLRSNIEIIAPELAKRAIPACFFVNTNFLDNKGLSYKYIQSLLIEEINKKKIISDNLYDILNDNNSSPESVLINLPYMQKDKLYKIATVLNIDLNEYLKDERPYLSSDDVKQLIDMGFEIGSHSLDHANFAELSDNEKLSQIEESFRILEKEFNIKYKLFSIPFSDFGVSAEFINNLFKNKTVDLLFSTAGMKHDSFDRVIQRIWMEKNIDDAKNSIKIEMLKNIIRKIVGQNTIKRK